MMSDSKDQAKLCVHCNKTRPKHNRNDNCLTDNADLLQRVILRTKFKAMPTKQEAA